MGRIRRPGRIAKSMTTDRSRSRSVVLVPLMVTGLVAVAIATGNTPRMLNLIYKLYNPWAAFVAVVMLVEYVLLKGADRSSIYRRELEACRSRRGEDLLGFQEMERELVLLREELTKSEGNKKGPQAARARIDALLERLRSHI